MDYCNSYTCKYIYVRQGGITMNMDITTRDEIIFGEYDKSKYSGGCRRFEGLDVEILNKLVDLDFLELDECQNNSPTTEEFIIFMEQYDGYTAHGYTIIDSRGDYRVTIEGIEKSSDDCISNDELIDFVDTFRFADELTIEKFVLYCWYD